MWEARHVYPTTPLLFGLQGASCRSILQSQDGYYASPYLQMIKAPTIQLCHDTGYFEDLINLFIISIACANKSSSSSLSADNLSFHGGIQYPLPSCGWDCHAQRIHSKPTLLLERMCTHTRTHSCTLALVNCWSAVPIGAVPGTDINQIPDMLRCVLEEKAWADVNQALALCLWFCFGRLIESHFTAACTSNELAPWDRVRSVWTRCFASATRARWRALDVWQAPRVWWALRDCHLRRLTCNVL